MIASLQVSQSYGTTAESLDEVISSLVTNGVLKDRSEAVLGGLGGILKSVDSLAVLVDEGNHRGVLGITSPALESVELWPENLAYFKVHSLEPGSGGEILSHLRALSMMAGVILDFRRAGGGDLESVSTLAGLARAENEPLFVVCNNQGTPLSTNVVAVFSPLHVPLMILTDEETEGASEALAFIMKGCRGVMLVGAMTRGDPHLRNWITLPGERVAWLATRTLVPISGKSYEKGGVMPDIVVDAVYCVGNDGLSRTNRLARALSPKSDADRALMMRVEGDAALRRATDILLGLQALGEYGRN
ncbi:MAG: S41 family peptidase [bacterium]